MFVCVERKIKDMSRAETRGKPLGSYGVGRNMREKVEKGCVSVCCVSPL